MGSPVAILATIHE